MRLNYVRSWNSIIGPVATDDIAEFIVLSGPNGSGKSNLLEAISNGSILVDGIPDPTGVPNLIRLFMLSQFVVTAEGQQSHATYRERWVGLQQQTANLVAQFVGPPYGLPRGSLQLEEQVRTHLLAGRQVSSSALDRMEHESGKLVTDFTVDDFRTYAPLLAGVRDPFALTIAELFLTYHHRHTQNKYLQWLATTPDPPSQTPLTDNDFVARFGQPPWTMLNETLSLVGLDYKFRPPQGHEETLTYETLLEEPKTGSTVKMAQLSSGEKTLMAVAMSVYTGDRWGEAIELPKVLLLDEADASLHPSMVKSLLLVANDIFAKRYGVKVIMTTHSPSTVALAPEESIYVMRRYDNPRLKRATRDEALRSLTVGVPTLSVRLENRRQVFTESEVDAACYHDLYALLSHKLDSPISLEFIASGSGKSGGSEAVKYLVTRLRNAGNTFVWGIVDRDSRQGAPIGIAYVDSRHSLENLVLDPLLIGAFLLREGIVSAAEMTLPATLRHFELKPDHAQHVADFISGRIARPDDDLTTVEVRYLGGFGAMIPRFCLSRQGHQIESRLIAEFPPLKKYGSSIKAQVIDKAVRDVPHFSPTDVLKLFAFIVNG